MHIKTIILILAKKIQKFLIPKPSKNSRVGKIFTKPTAKITPANKVNLLKTQIPNPVKHPSSSDSTSNRNTQIRNASHPQPRKSRAIEKPSSPPMIMHFLHFNIYK
jgi:hypothetical protein